MATKDPKLLTWQKTSPGRWERGIDEAELFYSSLAKTWEGTGRIFFAMTGCVELHVDISEHDDADQIGNRVETALRKAWRRLRYDHPTLASAVEYDVSSQTCKKVYETFIDDENGAKELEWLNNSFLLIQNGQSGNEFCNSDPPVQRYATLHIITPPEESQDLPQKMLRRDIVFRSHHDVIDGIGTLMLLNNLFRLASEAYDRGSTFPTVPFGTEFHNLSPPLRLAAHIPTEPTPLQRSKASLIIATNTTARDTPLPTLGVPLANNPVPRVPGINHRTAIHLSKPTTQALLQKCRAAHISATEAFHAAIILALRDLPGNRDPHKPTQRRYINKCLINLRAACAPPFNTSQHAAAVYHSGSGRAFYVDVDIPPLVGKEEEEASEVDDEQRQMQKRIQQEKDFAEIAARVTAFYRTVRQEPDHLAMLPLYYAAITPPYPSPSPSSSAAASASPSPSHQTTTTTEPIPPPNMNPSVSISSLGVLDRLIDARHGASSSAASTFRVQEPWVAADEYSTGVGVFLATWEGRMCLSAGFNRAFHDEAGVLAFLEGVKEAVCWGLGVL